MVDLRRTFNGLLRNWGHDVLLQRRLPDVYNDPHPKPLFATKLERHTVRHMYPTNRALADVQAEHMEGLVITVDMVYYFKWDVSPEEGDRIYEIDDRVPKGDSFRTVTNTVRELYTIDYALPMRGKGGSIIYWACGATRSDP